MEKKQIEILYKELINRIDLVNIYDGRGTVDLYECEKCHARKFTTYRDKGVTPFTINCDDCNGIMVHNSTYKSVPEDIKVEEWIRPSIEYVYNMNDAELEHLFGCGLFLKKHLLNRENNTPIHPCIIPEIKTKIDHPFEDKWEE